MAATVATLAHVDLDTPAAADVRQDTTPTSPTTTTPTTTTPAPSPGPSHWIASWGAAPQGPSPAAPQAQRGFRNQTLRQIVFSSVGGSQVRVRFTNLFGSRALRIRGAAVALQQHGAQLVPGSVRQLHFSGRGSVVIAPGRERLSDPVRLSVQPLSRLAITIYLAKPTGPATGHANSRETSYAARGGRLRQTSARGYRPTLHNWYFIDSLLTLSPRLDRGAVVALGDSITAGVGSSLGADTNWPDDLARRLAAQTGATLSVVDEGIGGNRVLNDSPCCGLSAVSRFSDDVRRQFGVRDVILLEGVNDLGFSQRHDSLSAPHTNVSARQIERGYQQIIAQAHHAGLRIFGGTLTPFRGARYWTRAAERKREAINRWILHSGAFDGVINFAAAVAEPGDPERLNPGYDYGDHLHLNNDGYRAMANAIDLRMLLVGRQSRLDSR